MRHLRRVSLLSESTGMTARNMAIVWAPNLLRSPKPQHALQGVAVQVRVCLFDWQSLKYFIYRSNFYISPTPQQYLQPL